MDIIKTVTTISTIISDSSLCREVYVGDVVPEIKGLKSETVSDDAFDFRGSLP